MNCVQLDSNQLQLRNLQQSAFNVNSSIDISQFIVKHPSTVKYPPPKPLFQLPESNNTKLVSHVTLLIHFCCRV